MATGPGEHQGDPPSVPSPNAAAPFEDGRPPREAPAARNGSTRPDAPPPLREALLFFARLGFIGFGGPAGQIAIMHKELVDRKGWIGERAFLRALNFCMILPGPEAQQLATYAGWRLHGIAGGVAAGILFILPSIFILLALSVITFAYGDVPAVRAILLGIQPMVVAIVADAVLRIGARTLRPWPRIVMAMGAFAALRILDAPFPVVIAGAAVLGFVASRVGVPGFLEERAPGTTPSSDNLLRARVSSPLKRAAGIVAVFAALWLIPFAAIVAVAGPDDVLPQVALFFTRVAFVTFGGAYAVLAYIADVAVESLGWLSASHMAQGLAFAETTPGPLIMVTEFVGFAAGWNHPGPHSPFAWGTAAALVTVYFTFLPSFLFVLVGAPHVEALASDPRLHAALTGVTAAVVGAIADLGVFLGGVVLLPAGEPALAAIGLGGFGFVLARRGLAVPWLVLIGAGAGFGFHLAGF